MKSKERDILGGRRNKRTLRRVCMALVAFGVATGGSALAFAQPVEFQMPPATRSPDDRSSNEVFRWQINRDECADEEAYFRFNLNVNGWDLTETLEVWGSFQFDCTDAMYRDGVAPDCKRLTTMSPNGTINRPVNLDVLIKDLVNIEDKLADDCGATSATLTARTLSVYFMLTASGTVVQGATLKWPPQGVTWQSLIDLWGPAPPTGISVTSGEGSVDLTLEGPQEQNSTAVVYCAKDGALLGEAASESDSSCSCSNVGDDSGSAGSAGNAAGGSAGTNTSSSTGTGSGGAGGMGGGGGTGGGSSGNGDSCNPGPLVPDELPNAAWTPCAEGTTVSDLENSKTYAIAVAYKDQVGNVGKLSEIICATPQPVEDFFENYKANGGAAGGGFCSIAPRTLRNTTFGTSFAVTALAFVMRRRSRQSRLVSSKEVSK